MIEIFNLIVSKIEILYYNRNTLPDDIKKRIFHFYGIPSNLNFQKGLKYND